MKLFNRICGSVCEGNTISNGTANIWAVTVLTALRALPPRPPAQAGGTASLTDEKHAQTKRSSQVWWHTPVTLAAQKAEAGESLECRSLRPAWATQWAPPSNKPNEAISPRAQWMNGECRVRLGKSHSRCNIFVLPKAKHVGTMI